ncbi:MAG: 16S rRNA (guanine(527)-N(7))-methyltransferase RsmG [Pseudomonadota bacterium]
MKGREAVSEVLGVSRETLGLLDAYVDLLRHWNARINLVSKGSLDQVWERHILDSAQLFRLSEDRRGVWIDLGSGAGLPGIVVAIMATADRRFQVRLIESDLRKSVFLQRVIDDLALPATIDAVRIEAVEPMTATVISARALAPLPRLLHLAAPFAADGTLCLFPKGRTVEDELTEARATWHIDCKREQSLSNKDGTILAIRSFQARA